MTTITFHVTGIVQGVGFRPFVYLQALKNKLTGYVLNNPHGVVITLQGKTMQIEAFLHDLKTNAPPLSRIDSITEIDIAEENIFSEFSIRESTHAGKPSTLISPDVCTCDDCLNELFEPTNRRYLYPFINCTNCGPRYTIIQKLPYDRPNTTMSDFILCAPCASEYKNPLDRRFHAQPNACYDCGPQLKLLSVDGKLCAGDPLLETTKKLQQGKIVAIKSIGGFHLAVDPANDLAVKELRKRKKRDEKPFALMTGDLHDACNFVSLTAQEREILLSRERPIVLAQRLNKSAHTLSEAVAPDNPYLGIMLPCAPLHFLMFYHPQAGGNFQKKKAVFPALIMTSANISEEPITKDNTEILQHLAGIADFFLVHNRDIHVRCDDSVVRVKNGKPSLIRRARGFAPAPVTLKQPAPQILAVGPELKNTLCLTDNTHAFISPYIGDLENIPTLNYFEEATLHFQNILDIHPRLFAYDLHPEYLSTKFIKNLLAHSSKKNSFGIGIQHHFAHIASVMAEHHLEEPVIGLAMDGTGYGTDHTIWGGEFLLCSPTQFKRAGFLKPLPLPGGSQAVKQPWRMALSYLCDAFPHNWNHLELNCLKQIEADKLTLLYQALQAKINAPLTSSLGRLFDAIASLLNIKHVNAFEGQAPMLLENTALSAPTAKPFAFDIQEQPDLAIAMNPELSGPWNIPDIIQDTLPAVKIRQLDYKKTIHALVQALQENVPAADLALGFHLTLVDSFTALIQKLSLETGIRTIVLSGGSWQNQILSLLLTNKLKDLDYNVLTNELIPVNDSGISLGQAYVASHVFAQYQGGTKPCA